MYNPEHLHLAKHLGLEPDEVEQVDEITYAALGSEWRYDYDYFTSESTGFNTVEEGQWVEL